MDLACGQCLLWKVLLVRKAMRMRNQISSEEVVVKELAALLLNNKKDQNQHYKSVSILFRNQITLFWIILTQLKMIYRSPRSLVARWPCKKNVANKLSVSSPWVLCYKVTKLAGSWNTIRLSVFWKKNTQICLHSRLDCNLKLKTQKKQFPAKQSNCFFSQLGIWIKKKSKFSEFLIKSDLITLLNGSKTPKDVARHFKISPHPKSEGKWLSYRSWIKQLTLTNPSNRCKRRTTVH